MLKVAAVVVMALKFSSTRCQVPAPPPVAVQTMPMIWANCCLVVKAMSEDHSDAPRLVPVWRTRITYWVWPATRTPAGTV